MRMVTSPTLAPSTPRAGYRAGPALAVPRHWLSETPAWTRRCEKREEPARREEIGPRGAAQD